MVAAKVRFVRTVRVRSREGEHRPAPAPAHTHIPTPHTHQPNIQTRTTVRARHVHIAHLLAAYIWIQIAAARARPNASTRAREHQCAMATPIVVQGVQVGTPMDVDPIASLTHGAAYTLVSADGVPILSPLVVEKHGANQVFLICGSPGNLRIPPNLHVDRAGGRGPWARFQLLPQGSSSLFALQCAGHLEKRGVAIFLSSAANQLVASRTLDRSALFSFVPSATRPSGAPPAPPPPPAFQLSEEQRLAFCTQGYVVLPGLISREMVEAALQAINHHMGLGPSAWGNEESGRLILKYGEHRLNNEQPRRCSVGGS